MKITELVSLLFCIILTSCSSAPEFNPKVNDINSQAKQNEDKISIITYNVQTIFGKKDEKIEGLTNYLDRELFDFVTLQELFDEKTRYHLIQNVDPKFYKSRISRIDYNSFPSNICQDSGLLSLSRFPKIDLTKLDFGENVEFTEGTIHQMLLKQFSISMDFFSNKSIMGSLYQVNNTTSLFLFTTHLQAISSRRHRINQLKQIQAFIQNAVVTVLRNNVVKNSENMIVILTGDFNYDAYTESDIETLQKYLGAPRDLYNEVNPDLKEYSLYSNMFRFYKRFDYIFSYDKIGPITLKSVNVNSINITDVKDKNGESISDHLALKAVLDIE